MVYGFLLAVFALVGCYCPCWLWSSLLELWLSLNVAASHSVRFVLRVKPRDEHLVEPFTPVVLPNP